ncbi:MAG: alpha-L-rhamnosidase C-terminal domain-containing protein, partial [bacterium]
DWMYRVVAGLDMDPARPGYRHLVIAPQPGGGFTYARASLTTPYGEAASGWKIVGDTMQVVVRVPANARATIRLPAAKVGQVREGVSPLASATGVTHSAQSGDAVVLEVGSGDYSFNYPWAKAGAASRGQ